MSCAHRVAPVDDVREPCRPIRELLVNGDFENGNLSGWQQLSGTGQVVARINPQLRGCTGDVPAGGRRGSMRLFSSSALDGATKDPRGTEVVLLQAISLAHTGLAVGDVVAASAFVHGDCTADSGGGQLIVDFMQGGAEGRNLDQTATDYVDPQLSAWHQLTTPPKRIPVGTDTIVFAFRSAVGIDRPSIELWVDDLSLAACGAQGAELASWRPDDSIPVTPAEPSAVEVAVDPGSTAEPLATSTTGQDTAAPTEPSEGSGGWSFHLTFDLGDNQTLALRRGRDWTENGVELFQARLDLQRLEGITSALYFAYGLTAGYWTARSEVCRGVVTCTSKDSCTCEGEGATWKSLAFAYGPTTGLALVGMDSDRKGAVLWIPIIKVSHLLSTVSASDEECAMGPNLCPDPGLAATTVMLEAGIGADFIYKGGAAGCGFRLNLVYLAGDIASRQDLGAMMSFSLAFGVGLFERGR